jgi:ubiquinone biosynthesis protein COQ9
MSPEPKTETMHIEEARAVLLAAAEPHVVFDGWTTATFDAAVEESGVDAGLALQACPRRGVDLAIAYHKAGDRAMVAAMQAAKLEEMRYSERVAFGVRARLEAADKEAVRRGMSLFTLPQYAAEGTSLVLGTVGLIWDTLGDTSTDVNWYTKRATLAGVYSSVLLFWLGDESEGFVDTWAFLDRRIDNVMQIEVVKAKMRDNPFVKAFMAGPGRILGHVKAPRSEPRSDLPGYVAPKN